MSRVARGLRNFETFVTRGLKIGPCLGVVFGTQFRSTRNCSGTLRNVFVLTEIGTFLWTHFWGHVFGHLPQGVVSTFAWMTVLRDPAFPHLHRAGNDNQHRISQDNGRW